MCVPNSGTLDVKSTPDSGIQHNHMLKTYPPPPPSPAKHLHQMSSGPCQACGCVDPRSHISVALHLSAMVKWREEVRGELDKVQRCEAGHRHHRPPDNDNRNA